MTLTYNTLVAQVLSEIERTDADTVAQVPNFIDRAQQKICRDSKTVGLEQYVTSAFTAGLPVYPKPGRWRRNITFNYGTINPINPPGALPTLVNQLQLRSYEFVRNYHPDPTVIGLPLFYSDYGYSNFLIAPTPNFAYPFELAYLELPVPISLAQQTNWLTDFAPDVLFSASVFEAVTYLKSNELIPIWEKQYHDGISSLNNQDTQRVVDRNSNRMAD